MAIHPTDGNWDSLPDADAETASTPTPRHSIGVAEATGEEPKNPRGEDRACGDGVTCQTVEVFVEARKSILAVRREAAESDGDDWRVDAASLGWCWWDGGGFEALPDGRVRVWARLKNWKHDRARRASVKVWVI